MLLVPRVPGNHTNSINSVEGNGFPANEHAIDDRRRLLPDLRPTGWLKTGTVLHPIPGEIRDIHVTPNFHDAAHVVSWLRPGYREGRHRRGDMLLGGRLRYPFLLGPVLGLEGDLEEYLLFNLVARRQGGGAATGLSVNFVRNERRCLHPWVQCRG